MNHKGTQIIHTERLVLRQFVYEDSVKVFDNWASDDEVTKYMNWATRKSIEEAEVAVQGWVSCYTKNNFYNWAIVTKKDNNPIGFIAVIFCDEKTGTVELGYCIGKKWWHRGIMAEALKAVIDFMFEEVGVQRIQAKHDAGNPASGRVMQKCGMQYEGTMRKAEITNNGICDVSCYAVLADDIR